jgi:hypothetical protein
MQTRPRATVEPARTPPAFAWRPFALAAAITTALIVARSAVYWRYEHAFFDSDQAIVGLMAKHLIEGRAFPLFYYGQTYMLGVDAWAMAPIFLVFGATVRSLHGTLVLMNLAAAGLLLYGLMRDVRLSAWIAIAPLVFFAFAPPRTAAWLIEAGANIGPLIYVPLLWLLRRRPLWFGVVLGIGVLNREFTIYVVPALLAGDAVTRALFTRERARFWLAAAVAALATWQGIQALKPYSDMMGPGTRGQLIRGEAGSAIGNVEERIAIVPSAIPRRAAAMVWTHLPGLWGLRRTSDAVASQGHGWLFWPITAGLLFALVRALWCRSRYGGRVSDGFAWYLATVGFLAAAVYVMTRNAEGIVPRYLLLTPLLPIGVTAAHLVNDRARWARAVTIAMLAVWTASSAVDHWAQVERYAHGLEPDEFPALVRRLDTREIHVAEAGYWRAYKVTFLTQERVKVASTDLVRIDEYQRLAQDAGASLVRIQEEPCPNGDHVGIWYLCRP